MSRYGDNITISGCQILQKHSAKGICSIYISCNFNMMADIARSELTIMATSDLELVFTYFAIDNINSIKMIMS